MSDFLIFIIPIILFTGIILFLSFKRILFFGSTIHEDRSFIEPEKVNTADEGYGKFWASIGKEIDEHNILDKTSKADSFLKHSIGCCIMAFGGFFLLLAIYHLVIVLFLGGANSKAIWNDGDNLRRIVTDGVIEYQVKNEKGQWYIVDEDTYKLKKFRETQK